MHLWCCLIVQATDTLNLLRQSSLHLQFLVYAHLNGPFDFNRTPLSPPGIKVLINEKIQVRRSWSTYGVDGWYLGPAKEHYRCYWVYCSKTGTERISDTVEFLPTEIPMPATALIDIVIRAAHELTHALLHPFPATPLSPFGDTQQQTLKALADIFLKRTVTSASYPAPLATTGALLPIVMPTRTATTSPPRVPEPPAPPRITWSPPRVPTVPSLPRRAPVHIVPLDEHLETPPSNSSSLLPKPTLTTQSCGHWWQRTVSENPPHEPHPAPRYW